MTEDRKRRKRREASSIDEPSPAPGAPPKSRVESRVGLWVVNSGRMKQYGDYVIERVGQVVRRQYLRNDELLLKHGYVVPLQEHMEARRCESCGLTFTGSVMSGPYKAHLEYARHDMAKVDLDTGLQAPDGRKPRVGDPGADPDVEDRSDWDLEPEGAPAERKLEEESPRGVRLSLGNR